MNTIKPNELPILAEVVMDENGGDVEKSLREIRAIDRMLTIVRSKTLVNCAMGRTGKGSRRNLPKVTDMIRNVIENI